MSIVIPTRSSLVTKYPLCYSVINGSIAWRGAWEKNTILLHMLNESITKPEDVVFDVNASTCRIVHVYVYEMNNNIEFC